MHPDVKSAARSAENSRAFRVLARGGYVANGVVHGLIGALMLSIAVTGHGDSDQSSAMSQLAAAPLGAALIWALTALLVALGVFQFVLGLVRVEGEGREKWGQRLSRWGQGVAFLALGAIAGSVALGDRSDGDSSAEQASRGLLDLPGGPVLLAVVGAGIVVAGGVFVVMGIRRAFEKQMRIPDGALGRSITGLGVAGYAAKGVSIGVIGVLITVAAVRDDPGSAGALDAAVQTLADLPAGPVLVALVGAGFIAYGVFCGFRARWAKL